MFLFNSRYFWRVFNCVNIFRCLMDQSCQGVTHDNPGCAHIKENSTDVSTTCLPVSPPADIPVWSRADTTSLLPLPCCAAPCQNNATCYPVEGSTDSYVCVCLSGYEGVNCSIETNECDSNPCLNEGTLFYVLLFYVCHTGLHQERAYTYSGISCPECVHQFFCWLLMHIMHELITK